MIASIFLFNFCDIIQFARFLNNDISYLISKHSISGLLFVLGKHFPHKSLHMLNTTLVTTWRGVKGSISMHWHWWSFWSRLAIVFWFSLRARLAPPMEIYRVRIEGQFIPIVGILCRVVLALYHIQIQFEWKNRKTNHTLIQKFLNIF